MFKAFARSYLRFSNSGRPPTSQHLSSQYFRPSNSGRSSLRPLQSLGLFAVLSILPSAIAFSAFAFVDSNEAQDINRKLKVPSTFPAFSLWTSSLPEREREREPSTEEMAPSNALPGRPGNLTKEEEAKLKQLWFATLRVFGVSNPDSEPSSPPPGTPTIEEPKDLGLNGVSSASPDSRKKNRKSLGRFLSRKSRSEKETEKKEELVQEVAANLDTSDDKYGQINGFKAALARQTPAELREAFWGMVKCDNPDALLLRFLRARKWDVDKALVMMVSTMNWRSKELNVQEVIERGEGGFAADPDQGFIKQLRMGKSFLHGCDREGRPICLVRVRLHRQADQSEESLEQYTVYIMETARLMLREPVDTAAVVFDMSGFSMANMDYAPVKYLIKCFEAHYPESLGICLVHKAPWIFQSIWSIIRGWLDPVVASKIHFTKTTEDMESFIPRANIIKDLGGDDDWEYTYIEPAPNENDAIANGGSIRARLQAKRDEQIREYEALTRSWITADDGEKIRSERFKVAAALRDGYWEMDPYLRARTLYERTGVLGEKGMLDFYRYKKPVAVAQGNAAIVTSLDDVD